MRSAGRLILVLACGAALLAAGLRAAEDSYVDGMADKFSHGIVNAATGWMELPVQIKRGYDRGVPCVKACAGTRSLGAAVGLGRGVSHTLGRTVWGVWELVTFWAPNHTTNAELLLLQDSVYPWEEGIVEPFRCPTAQDGVRRIGMRLERGLDDVVGSPVEILGQTKKAAAEGSFLPGIPKGLYCMAGRLLSGIGDIAFFALPSPVDNLMVPFAEVKPWDAWDGKYRNNLN